MTAPVGKEKLDSIETLRRTVGRALLEMHVPAQDAHGNPSLSRFLLENGRLPFITDEVKPWRYRGWLVPYIQLAEVLPEVSPRYDYVLRTLGRGRLLDEPLPQISFVGESEPATKAGMKMLQKCLDQIEHKSGYARGISDFCEWLAFGLGVVSDASKLAPDVQEYLYRDFDLRPLLLHPSDYLGQILTESRHGKKSGFYPTPIHLAELMSRLVNPHKYDRDSRSESTLDCAVGTGRLLLVASNYSMRLFGQDIDYLCCLITKINLALYAPWFYVPESFFPAEARKTAPVALTPPETASAAETAATNKTLFDLSPPPASAEKSKPKAAKKVYTIRIDEQPTLFDLFQSNEENDNA